MSKLGIVINPRARALRRRPQLAEKLRRSLAPEGTVALSPDLETLDQIAADFHDRGIDLVGIVGGDGTLGITIAAFEKAYPNGLPRFALLRGGTMNTIARSIGQKPLSPLDNLNRLLNLRASGQLRTDPRATLRANNRLGFLFGTGVFATFMHEYYRRGDGDPSPWTAAKTITAFAASTLVQGPLARSLAQRQRLQLEIDGRARDPQPYLAVTAGTVAQVGLGFTPFFLSDGLQDAFHFLALKGDRRTILTELPKVWRGRALRPEAALSQKATAVTLHADGGQEIPYMVDGDIGTATGTLRLEAGPTLQIARLHKPAH